MDLFPRILISSSDLVPSGQPGANEKLPKFKPGQIIKAKVLGAVSSRQARLQIAGKTMLAKTGISLVDGETILLEVSKGGSEPILKLIWSEGNRHVNAGHDLLGMLSRSGPYKLLTELLNTLKSSIHSTYDTGNLKNKSEKSIQKLLARLENSVQEISLKSDSADRGLINRLIKYGGLTLESRLGNAVNMKNETIKTIVKESSELDMKALALKIAEVLGKEGSAAGRAAGKFAEFLETLQLFNQYTSETSGRYLLPMPILFDNLLKFGQLLIDIDKKDDFKKKKEDRLIRISLLLELSNIGDFLAEILVLKKNVTGFISVGSNAVKMLVDQNIPSLVNKLNENGFEIQSLDCRVISPKTLAETSLIDKMINKDDGLLNLIV